MTIMLHARSTGRANTDEFALRPATDHDRVALAAFFSELSPLSSFQRFFSGAFRVTEASLDLLMCRGRTGRAFVAVDGDRVVGHAMWATAGAGRNRAEIAFVVAADRRGRGLGTELARLAVADATRRGFREIEATVLASNSRARRVVERVLPLSTTAYDDGEIAYAASVAPGTHAVLRRPA